MLARGGFCLPDNRSTSYGNRPNRDHQLRHRCSHSQNREAECNRQHRRCWCPVKTDSLILPKERLLGSEKPQVRYADGLLWTRYAWKDHLISAAAPRGYEDVNLTRKGAWSSHQRPSTRQAMLFVWSLGCGNVQPLMTTQRDRKEEVGKGFGAEIRQLG